ncbi:DUF3325 domain-containing protein [Alcaligenes sp. Marseille-Q7550]
MNALNITWLDHIWIFLACCLGFTGLALSMDRHQQDRWGRVLSRRAAGLLRGAGWLLLGLAMALAVRSMGWGFGLVACSGHASAAAAAVFVGLLTANRIRPRQ